MEDTCRIERELVDASTRGFGKEAQSGVAL